MTDDEWTRFAAGLIWGMGLILWLIRFELWLERRPAPAPADPFETMRWEVLQAARDVTRDAAG